MDIGRKLRNLRLQNDLTQEELASRLDLTKGYISQLENNLTSPSLQTLFSILEVLGSDVKEFFGSQQDQPATYHALEYTVKVNEELRNKITWIVPDAQKYQMEPIIIDIEPNGQSAIDDAHPGEEFGYVLYGEVTLVLNKKRYIVKAGETFYYRANKEHYLINHTNSKVRILWISTPPMF